METTYSYQEKRAFPDGFFQAENRGGYQVSALMKQVWGIELDMLQELLRICEKHNLRIWADGGTLIGAVRHKGFIPWDDDIDLSMPRADYDKLQEIGPDELKAPYFFQTIHTDPGYTHRHIQIRHSETAVWKQGQKTYTCNSGIFIDIFPLDAMPADPRGFKKHYNKVSALKRRLRFVQRVSMKFPKLYAFCREHVPFLSDKKLFGKYEALLRSVSPERKAAWTEITFNHACPMYPVNSYRETVYADFEFLKLPIPADYDSVLTIMYGDYMTPAQIPSGHGTLNYDVTHSYKEILKKWTE